MPALSAIKPTSTLPPVLAVLSVEDHGPCEDGQASAQCPHCGAGGRYIIHFLCEDGRKRGAMKGCFRLFPKADVLHARLVQEAFSRRDAAARDKKPLARWWQAILNEVDALAVGTTPDTAAADAKLFAERVAEIEATRQAWLKRNGYGRRAH